MASEEISANLPAEPGEPAYPTHGMRRDRISAPGSCGGLSAEQKVRLARR